MVTPSGTSSLALWEEFHLRTGGLGDRVAVTTPTTEVTFAALWGDADRLASRFVEAGIAEGSLVGLALSNSARFVSAFLALCRLGASVALISPGYGRGELEPILRDLRPACFVTDQDVADRMGAAVPIRRSSSANGLMVLIPAGADERPTAFPAALLKFSSGSTAEPKAIALSATNVIAEAENVMATLDLGPGDHILAGVPIFHSYGFDLGVLQTLYAGATLVLEDAFVPRRTLATLADSHISVFLGVPAQYRVFLATSMSAAPNLSGVRWLLSCTAPLSPDVITSFMDRFGAPICQHYGSSETGAVTTHVPSEVCRLPSSVGRPMLGVRVNVVGADGIEVPAGVEGEVVVKGEAVARGYELGGPSGASPFREGAFWTGDLGVIDPEGFLTLLGRRDAIINVGGLKVSPEEVAATLERHPDVREAAAVGVLDGQGEEVVCAVVAPARPVSEADLLAFCRGALAEHKVPRRIEFRDELPRTASGKLRVTRDDLD